MKQLEDLSRFRVDEAIQDGLKAQRIHLQNGEGKRRRSQTESLFSLSNMAENLAKLLRILKFGYRFGVKKPKNQIEDWWKMFINRKGDEADLTSR